MEMIWSVTREVGLSTSDHILVQKEERRDKKIRDDTNKANPNELVEELESSDRRLILSSKNKCS